MALRGTLTHRKTRRLARLLNIPIPCALGVMEALWHVTGEQAPDGAIGRMSDDDIADEMFWDATSGEELVNALVAAALLDVDDEHRLVVHDWHEHADRHVKRKLVRNGQQMAGQRAAMAGQMETEDAQFPDMDASCGQPQAPEPEPEPVPEPEPEPVPGPNTDPSPSGSGSTRKSRPPQRVPDDAPELWDQFTAIYPRRSGSSNKAQAEGIFRKILAGGVAGLDVIAGVKRYRAFMDAQPLEKGTGSQFVQMMTTFLNRRQWLEPWTIPPQQQARPPGRGQLGFANAGDTLQQLQRDLLERKRGIQT